MPSSMEFNNPKASCYCCHDAPTYIPGQDTQAHADCKCEKPTPIFSMAVLPGDSDTEPCTSDDSSIDSTPSMSPRVDLTFEDDSDSSDDESDDGEDLKRSMCAARLPSLDEVLPRTQVEASIPEVIRALHYMSQCTEDYGVSVVDAYKSLRLEPELRPELPPSGHLDGGALASTTDRIEYLWCYRHATPEERRTKFPRLRVADDTVHVPHGIGYLKTPCDNFPGYVFVETLYTPQIPATILSPDCLARALKCKGYSTYSDFVDNSASLELTDCDKCQTDVTFQLRRIRGLLYTNPIIKPTDTERTMTELPEYPSGSTCQHPDNSSYIRPTSDIRQLTTEQLRALWHMRLGHVNDRAVADMHKFANGIPKLPRADVLTKCDMCARCKLHKANRNPTEERQSTECWQHLQADFGFFVTRSSGKKKRRAKAKSGKTRRAPSQVSVYDSEDDPIEESPPDLSKSVYNVGIEEPQPRRSARIRGRTAHAPVVTPAAKAGEGDTTPDRNPAVEAGEGTKVDGSTSASTAPTEPPPPNIGDDSQFYSFEKIVTHEGPIEPGHKRDFGAKYNLKIKWSNGQTTWEPYSNIFADARHEVIECARRKGLLGNSDWWFVRDAALTARDEEATFDDETELPGRDVIHQPVEPISDAIAQEKADAANARFRSLVGLNGETCYVSIACLHSGSIRVSIRRDKAPPLDFFKEFLARYGSSRPDRSIRLDLGGELGRSEEVQKIWREAGYAVETTAPATSNEIGGVERPHLTLSEAVRTMLFAAGLELKFWPYALRYWIFIHDLIPHGDRPASPYSMCNDGALPNISLLRIFGCRIYALPPNKRDSKLKVHARAGIFLGYKRSMRHAYYYDLETKTVKTARHVVFDEGMNDLKNPPPFVHFLRGGTFPEEENNVHLKT